MQEIAIHWFRKDLRLNFNPALSHAVAHAKEVIPLYIHDDSLEWSEGGAGKWWLHHSLEALKKDLESKGSNLIIKKGNPLDILKELTKEHNIKLVCWNRLYEPEVIKRDTEIKSVLKSSDIECESFNGSLLLDPWESKNKTGNPYQVFTPFWRNLQNLIPERKSLSKITKINSPKIYSESIDSLNLLPNIPWDKEFYNLWQPGETGGQKCLKHFLKIIDNYKEQRDFPSVEANSKLSPHLHFGEISPLDIWMQTELEFKNGKATLVEPFLRQLGWREFAHHLLFHFPDTTKEPLRKDFKKFPWVKNKKHLTAWQKGLTGYPIIDAGMRELWTTGIMHNRVRMIVGSFLVKNLLIHWHEGAKWFWDTLIDADLANNTLGWQWIAGCGADAAPYFRIFNPVTQSEKFDTEGKYIKKWVPELASLPAKIIHAPWLQTEETLRAYGVEIGTSYPEPIVDLKETRERALESYAKIKTQKL
jgi:deoxyribodipyrimidine photo-lyase